ncbi:DNA-binding protein [Rhodoplanes serenus]|uniref:DNA-binding protein n=1 Tax=Rhodoplanes serenus TaxID=200615 RepID=A0A9X4XK94_9BRAD|nr:DNA-binding protein [Rhodoplanes serenus]MTW16618.1 DNA-binding protein [Rhodoplanes serenus]
MPKLAYRIPELVSAGPFGRTKLYDLIAEGLLPTRKVRGVVFVLADDWERLLREAPVA